LDPLSGGETGARELRISALSETISTAVWTAIDDRVQSGSAWILKLREYLKL